MIYTYFFTVLLVSIWSFNSYIKKTVTNKISSDQIIFILSLFSLVTATGTILVKQYVYKNNNLSINFFNNKNITSEIILKLMTISIFGFIASSINLHLLNKNNLSSISPLIHSLEIVFAIIIGYLFLNEELGLHNFIGGILIICGIVVMNK